MSDRGKPEFTGGTAGIRSDAQLFAHLFSAISSQRFLKMQGLGNEVPFYICPFKPEKAFEMDRMCSQLAEKLTSEGISVLAIDLYDISIELLKERGLFDRLIAGEAGMPKDYFLETLDNVLDPRAYIAPEIGRRAAAAGGYDVMFISGVGEVFPYIRSHNILEELQITIKGRPVVMFFPGEYSYFPGSGSSLKLFGRLEDNKYYRAQNILNYQI